MLFCSVVGVMGDVGTDVHSGTADSVGNAIGGGTVPAGIGVLCRSAARAFWV